MSSFVLIDSSAWIFAVGPNPLIPLRERVEYLIEQNLAAVTSPIYFEILSSAHSDADRDRFKFHLSVLHPFPFSVDDWTEAAEWVRTVRKKGVKIKTIDGLIAFKAIKHHLTLLHADADFDRLAKKTDLRVESYVASARRR